MANFYYDPGVQDRRGELLAQGLSQASESLSEGIQRAKQKHNENKAYAQLAGVLGLDPKHSTKLDVQAAMLRNEVLQARQAQQQKQTGQQALARFSKTYQADRAGGPDLPATLALGRGPLRNPILRQPMQSGDALADALAKNPALFGDPQTADTAVKMSRLFSSMNNGSGITIDPNTGLPILRSGNSTRVINPAWVNGGAGARPLDSGYKTINIPGQQQPLYVPYVGRTVLQDEIPNNPRFSNQGTRGMLPPGTKFTNVNGRTVAVTPDGWLKPIAGNTDSGWQTITGQGQSVPDTDAVASEPDAAPKANSTSEMEKVFADGSGKQFKYLGDSENPMSDTNADNWQIVQ